MKISYAKMTNEDEYRILCELVSKMSAATILGYGDVETILKEELNNDILDQWARENPELAQDWSEEEQKINRLDRDDVVRLLEQIAGCQCYDNEDLPTLRIALLENVKDGTVGASDLDI